MSKPRGEVAWPGRLGRRIAPPRFLAFLVLLPVGYLGYGALFASRNWQDSLAMAFDFAAVVFLVSLYPLFRDSSVARIRQHSRDNDANRLLVLVLTTLLTLVVMAAISGELAIAKGGDRVAMTKLVVTLLLIWLFANGVYTLHYAHFFYATDADKGGDVGGLKFPETGTPGYDDFAYFALTLGMALQTSDVLVTHRRLRSIVLLHCMGAFLFNIGVIAFTINALGGGGGGG